MALNKQKKNAGESHIWRILSAPETLSQIYEIQIYFSVTQTSKCTATFEWIKLYSLCKPVSSFGLEYIYIYQVCALCRSLKINIPTTIQLELEAVRTFIRRSFLPDVQRRRQIAGRLRNVLSVVSSEIGTDMDWLSVESCTKPNNAKETKRVSTDIILYR